MRLPIRLSMVDVPQYVLRAKGEPLEEACIIARLVLVSDKVCKHRQIIARMHFTHLKQHLFLKGTFRLKTAELLFSYCNVREFSILRCFLSNKL